MALLVLTVASAGMTAALTRLRGATAKAITAATIGMSAVFIQVPSIAALLHLVPLHPDDWVVAVSAGLLASLAPAIGWFRK